MGLLDGAWHFASGIPGHIFPESRLQTGLGIAACLCFTAVVITFLIGLWMNAGELAKGWDSKWNEDGRLEKDKDKQEFKDDGYTIDWRRARLQQAVIPRFAVPFAITVLASMAYLLWFDFSWRGYWHIAVAWFLLAIPLRIWWISAMKRASVCMYTYDLLERGDFIIRGKTMAVFRFYVAWGASKKQADSQRRFFRYRLRRLNGLFTFLRLDLVSMRLIKPVLEWLFYGITWPVAMVVSVFVLTHNIIGRNKHFDLRPDWARKHTSPPSDRGLYTVYEPMPEAA